MSGMSSMQKYNKDAIINGNMEIDESIIVTKKYQM